MNPRVVTPLVSAGAAWATKKSMNSIYAKRHEGTVPSRDDTQVPFRQVLLWTLTTAIVVALVDVAIQQAIARWSQSEQQELTA
ncbi:MAG: DUF4235 domain-containing protein [Candidatus Nanopelagicales bacterium]